MQRDKRDIERALARKGFRQNEGDHHVFVYYTSDGTLTEVKTRTSHGAKSKSIGSSLLGKMARQCHLDMNTFLQLVDCPLSREQYETHLIASKTIQAS